MNSPRNRYLTSLIVLCAALSLFTTPTRADFSSVGDPKHFTSISDVTETRFEATRGPSPFDRIGLHRVSRNSGSGNKGPVILFLPGTNMNGETPIDDPHHNAMLFLAAHDVDTWTLDYRTHFIPPETPPDKLDGLQKWTADLFESDIDAAVDLILKQSHRPRLFLAGFSRGASFAYLYAAAHSGRVQGLIILDGFVLPKSEAAGAVSSVLSKLSGRYATDVGGKNLTFDKRKALLKLVMKNPDAPAPIPKYRTARENLEHVVYDSSGFGGHGGLANPQGGFSDAVVLAHFLILYDRYWPAVQDQEHALTAQLRQQLSHSNVPVLAFNSTNIAPGWPAMVRESAQATGSPDVSVVELKDWGHVDVLCGSHAEEKVYTPMLDWITRHAK
jgi:pimeloyl-ACP methyl ester carboxylesterase